MCTLWESCSDGRWGGWWGRWRSGGRHCCFLWQEELGECQQIQPLTQSQPIPPQQKTLVQGLMVHLSLSWTLLSNLDCLCEPFPALGCAGRAEEAGAQRWGHCGVVLWGTAAPWPCR